MAEIRSQVASGSAIDQAITGVEGITLRVDASPAANQGRVLVPPTNPFVTLKGSDANPNVLFPRDVAVHELTHLVQEGVSGAGIGTRGGREQRGMGGATNFNAVSVGEGLADSESMLTTKSTASGGEYLGPKGIYKSVRDFAHPSGDRHVFQKVSTNYNEVNHNAGDPHEYGGVVAEIFLEVSKKSSNAQALVALHGVFEDPAFAASNQGWLELRDSLKLQADAARDRADPVLAAAIETSLNDHGLSTTE